MWQTIQKLAKTQLPHPDPHQLQKVQLQSLLERVQLFRRFDKAHENSHSGTSLPMQTVSQELQTILRLNFAQHEARKHQIQV